MLTTELILDDVHAGFLGMTTQAEKRADAFFVELRPSGRKDVRQHQRDRSGPDASWPARAASTQERARRAAKPKRRRGPKGGLLGNLPRAWKVYTDTRGLKFLHRVAWAGVHDTGGRVGRGARVPRRQFAYWSPEFLDSAARQFRAFVLRGWERA